MTSASLLAVLGVGLALAVIAWWRTRASAARLAASVRRLARGELDAPPATGTQTVGELAALESAIEALRARLRTLVETAAATAEGRQTTLSVEADDELGRALDTMRSLVGANAARATAAEERATALAARLAGEVDELSRAVRDEESGVVAMAESGRNLETLAVELVGHITRVSEGVRTTSVGIAGTTASIEQVTRGGEVVLRAVEDASATMETVASSVTSVAQTAESLSNVAQQVAREAAAGGRLLGDSAEKLAQAAARAQQSEAAIERLTHRSKEIGTIVRVIEAIADQSNLLALNAAIEAARAGDAGRGFAVVADEVRKLAERSMAATHEIGLVIGAAQQDNEAVVKAARSILGDIHDGAGQVSDTSRSLTTILQSIEQVTAQVADVQRATQEQSFAATEVMKLVENMNDVARRVVSVTGEQTAASAGVVAAVQATEVALAAALATIERQQLALEATRGAGERARRAAIESGAIAARVGHLAGGSPGGNGVSRSALIASTPGNGERARRIHGGP
ncbi:MAG TPA: methyl-accepting chemotaxis protein [Kofleriaceae bacterium]|nr:methyl-accepting chemotaxis protein [Kofleriaceae bacterium]